MAVPGKTRYKCKGGKHDGSAASSGSVKSVSSCCFWRFSGRNAVTKYSGFEEDSTFFRFFIVTGGNGNTSRHVGTPCLCTHGARSGVCCRVLLQGTQTSARPPSPAVRSWSCEEHMAGFTYLLLVCQPNCSSNQEFGDLLRV